MSAAENSTGRFRSIVYGTLRDYRASIAGAGICVVMTAVLALAAPWPLKILFDNVLLGKPLSQELKWLESVVKPGDFTSLIWLAGMVITFAVLSAFFAYFQILMTSRVGLEIVHRLRSELFDRLQRRSVLFHSQSRTGELLNKLVSDTNTLRDTYSEYLVSSVTHALTIVGICIVMFAIDVQLAALVVLTFPILFLGLLGILRTVRNAARDQRNQESELVSRLSEVLGAIPLVQAYGREDHESAKFASSSLQSRQKSIRTARAEAGAARLVEVARSIGTALVVVLGGMQALRGRISPGDFLVFSTYIVNLYKPVRVLARLSSRLYKASASAERVREIIDTPLESQDAPDALPVKNVRGEIVFEDVAFAYKGSDPVLNRLSFRIPAGSTVAMVGASGSGKSTIINLIVRFFDPSEGRILIDGIDIRTLQRKSYRSHVGLVMQETLLFGASVSENIAYGKENASKREIIAAAKQATAHEFIKKLPDGYDTVLDQRATNLSGGQRQRLCLARALLMKPEILVLDEPTSAIDHKSEVKIRSMLSKERGKRTTLIVAHHLQTVREADIILVVHDGGIVEQGSHDELVRKAGHYCRLFQIEPPVQPHRLARRA